MTANPVMTESGLLRLSPSKFLLWDQCHRHFLSAITQEHENVQTIYSVTGTAYHTVLERINKGAELAPEARVDMAREELLKECAEKGVDIQFTKAFTESKEFLRAYAMPPNWEFISSEHKRLLERPDLGIALSYIIDAVFRNKDTGVIYIDDYKTSAQKPDTNLQLQLYCWAEVQRAGYDPDGLIGRFVMTRKGQIVQVRFSRAQYDQIEEYVSTSARFMRKLLEVEAAGRPGFLPTGSAKNCRYCPVPGCEERV